MKDIATLITAITGLLAVVGGLVLRFIKGRRSKLKKAAKLAVAPTPTPDGRAAVAVIAVGIVLVVVSILAISLPWNHSYASSASTAAGSSSESSHQPASPTSSSPIVIPIKINQIGPSVAECTTFAGIGDVPQGQTLWLIIYTDEPKYYFFPVDVDPVAHSWKATVTVGADGDPAGTSFVIYADLLDETTNQLINEGDFPNGVTSLPKGIVETDHISVRRSSDHMACK